tara:strand:+ start:801 stop:1106 length:306 start_codon:yes stop_codon:yes gene_type:complete
MKLFGIIGNVMVFEDQYSMPTIFIDISDADKETLIDEGAYTFSDWDFVHAIPEAIARCSFKVLAKGLRMRNLFLTEGDKMVLDILENNETISKLTEPAIAG